MPCSTARSGPRPGPRPPARRAGPRSTVRTPARRSSIRGSSGRGTRTRRRGTPGRSDGSWEPGRPTARRGSRARRERRLAGRDAEPRLQGGAVGRRKRHAPERSARRDLAARQERPGLAPARRDRARRAGGARRSPRVRHTISRPSGRKYEAPRAGAARTAPVGVVQLPNARPCRGVQTSNRCSACSIRQSRSSRPSGDQSRATMSPLGASGGQVLTGPGRRVPDERPFTARDRRRRDERDRPGGANAWTTMLLAGPSHTSRPRLAGLGIERQDAELQARGSMAGRPATTRPVAAHGDRVQARPRVVDPPGLVECPSRLDRSDPHGHAIVRRRDQSRPDRPDRLNASSSDAYGARFGREIDLRATRRRDAPSGRSRSRRRRGGRPPIGHRATAGRTSVRSARP